MKGNILKLSNLKKDSEWCDKDRVFLYACFQILVDFIEKEKPQKIVKYNCDNNHKRIWKELQALYRYWKIERPNQERRINKLGSKWIKSRKTKFVTAPDGRSVREITLKEDLNSMNLFERELDIYENLEEDMLLRLVKMRRHLAC